MGRIKQNRNIPDDFQDLESWKINRRKFVGTLGVLGMASQISFLQSCKPIIDVVYLANDYLTAQQSEVLQKIQMILFPNDGNGPSAKDVNAFNYLMGLF